MGLTISFGNDKIFQKYKNWPFLDILENAKNVRKLSFAIPWGA